MQTVLGDWVITEAVGSQARTILNQGSISYSCLFTQWQRWTW
ncbi:hypothetical protein RchiOBHm_Chr6g0265491 [Rosa chinensis]|uniref:Uncharacterized protein n=1 Tax=Rosa chinensis TaxID=74649 RepID=A0A2P6PPG1_ROSCH|nr:hypothetical protein RchiOBHm_Chr6g0265491 [Rosa chinensis]